MRKEGRGIGCRPPSSHKCSACLRPRAKVAPERSLVLGRNGQASAQMPGWIGNVLQPEVATNCIPHS